MTVVVFIVYLRTGLSFCHSFFFFSFTPDHNHTRNTAVNEGWTDGRRI